MPVLFVNGGVLSYDLCVWIYSV